MPRVAEVIKSLIDGRDNIIANGNGHKAKKANRSYDHTLFL